MKKSRMSMDLLLNKHAFHLKKALRKGLVTPRDFLMRGLEELGESALLECKNRFSVQEERFQEVLVWMKHLHIDINVSLYEKIFDELVRHVYKLNGNEEIKWTYDRLPEERGGIFDFRKYRWPSHDLDEEERKYEGCIRVSMLR